MIYNISAREARLLLHHGGVSLIEMEPAWDDDRPPHPPAESLLLCRREGDQYCLAATATADWQAMARCRVLSIVRRNVMALDDNEARHVLRSLPVLPLGKSYRRVLASWWRRKGIASDRILIFRVVLEDVPAQMPAAVETDAGAYPRTGAAIGLALVSFGLFALWVILAR